VIVREASWVTRAKISSRNSVKSVVLSRNSP